MKTVKEFILLEGEILRYQKNKQFIYYGKYGQTLYSIKRLLRNNWVRNVFLHKQGLNLGDSYKLQILNWNANKGDKTKLEYLKGFKFMPLYRGFYKIWNNVLYKATLNNKTELWSQRKLLLFIQSWIEGCLGKDIIVKVSAELQKQKLK